MIFWASSIIRSNPGPKTFDRVVTDGFSLALLCIACKTYLYTCLRSGCLTKFIFVLTSGHQQVAYFSCDPIGAILAINYIFPEFNTLPYYYISMTKSSGLLLFFKLLGIEPAYKGN